MELNEANPRGVIEKSPAFEGPFIKSFLLAYSVDRDAFNAFPWWVLAFLLAWVVL